MDVFMRLVTPLGQVWDVVGTRSEQFWIDGVSGFRIEVGRHCFDVQWYWNRLKTLPQYFGCELSREKETTGEEWHLGMNTKSRSLWEQTTFMGGGDAVGIERS